MVPEEDDIHESKLFDQDEGDSRCAIFKTKPIGITNGNVFMVFWIAFASALIMSYGGAS